MKTYIFSATHKDYKVKSKSFSSALNEIFEKVQKEQGNRYSKNWIKERLGEID